MVVILLLSRLVGGLLDWLAFRPAVHARVPCVAGCLPFLLSRRRRRHELARHVWRENHPRCCCAPQCGSGREWQ